jgi:outer membrane protein OmpA-like peptidoglycan-associated protein
VTNKYIIAPLACAAVALAGTALADPPIQWHAEAGTARALGGWQGYEYGSGGSGAVAVELPFGRVIGAQIEAGGLWLPRVNASQDPTVASGSDGSVLAGMGGLRVHPFGDFAGPWIDANAGYLRTGSDDRFGFDAHLGYDWRVDQGRLDVGPYVGYLQVVEPSSSLRPEDARVVTLGLHVAMGRERPHEFLVKAPPAAPVRVVLAPPPTPPSDRDEDGILDADDACPAVPGLHTDDPATNGCPPHAEVRIVENHLEFDDVILFATDSPQVDVASYPVLVSLAKFIQNNPEIARVDIAGHADERGTDAHNLALSNARARSVRELLVRFGVEPARLLAEAFGETKPRAPGHTEDDWRQNRRVEFAITRAAPGAQAGTTTLGVEEKQR